MRKICIFLLLICTVVSALPSCGIKSSLEGDRNVLPREYNLDGSAPYTIQIENIRFDSVMNEAGNPIEFYVNTDDSLNDKLYVTTDDNIFSSITVETENHIIKISGDPERSYAPSEFEISAGVPVNNITVTGKFTVNIINSECETLSLLLSESVKATAVTERLTSAQINLAGSSALTIDGSASALTAELGGTCVLNSYGFKTDTAEIKCTGMSNAYVNTAITLNASVGDNGNVWYKGNPEITKGLSGLGVIEPAV